MENSKNSFSFIPFNLSCNNVRINEEQDDSFDQESGWTSYVQDFSSSVSSESSYYSSSSSSSYSKSCNNGGVVKFCMEMNHSHRFNRLRMKRSRKMGEDDDDEELEDTATSGHSPIAHEVQYLNQMEMDLRLDNNPKQKKRREIITQVKEGNCSISGLKDIGLCLVPLSMAVNYFG